MSALTTGVKVQTADKHATVTRRVVTRTEHAKGWSESRRDVPDYDIKATVELWIDYAEIFKMLSRKAMLSKSKKAQAMRGAVVIRAKHIIKTKEHPRDETQN